MVTLAKLREKPSLQKDRTFFEAKKVLKKPMPLGSPTPACMQATFVVGRLLSFCSGARAAKKQSIKLLTLGEPASGRTRRSSTKLHTFPSANRTDKKGTARSGFQLSCALLVSSEFVFAALSLCLTGLEGLLKSIGASTECGKNKS